MKTNQIVYEIGYHILAAAEIWTFCCLVFLPADNNNDSWGKLKLEKNINR